MASSTPPSASPKSVAEEKDTVKFGSCLCKAVRYKLIGDPIVTHICNCTNCKKVTGAAFMWNGIFEKKQIEMVQGEESLTMYFDKETKSGHPLERYFCKICGSNIFVQPLRPVVLEKNMTIVALGSLDGPIEWVPQREHFQEHRVPYLEEIKFAWEKPNL